MMVMDLRAYHGLDWFQMTASEQVDWAAWWHVRYGGADVRR